MPLGEIMADCPNPTAISPWIPVIGTLLGATIGFVGGLFNSWLTQKSKESTEKEGRERGRVEKLYETLLEIKMYYQGLLSEMISKVHFDTKNIAEKPSGIPPLVNLDMVIHLYFPSLTVAHKQFVAVKERFGEKYGENLTKSFANEKDEAKKTICSEYMALFKELDAEISNLQQELASMAKA